MSQYNELTRLLHEIERKGFSNDLIDALRRYVEQKDMVNIKYIFQYQLQSLDLSTMLFSFDEDEDFQGDADQYWQQKIFDFQPPRPQRQELKAVPNTARNAFKKFQQEIGKDTCKRYLDMFRNREHPNPLDSGFSKYWTLQSAAIHETHLAKNNQTDNKQIEANNQRFEAKYTRYMADNAAHQKMLPFPLYSEYTYEAYRDYVASEVPRLQQLLHATFKKFMIWYNESRFDRLCFIMQNPKDFNMNEEAKQEIIDKIQLHVSEEVSSLCTIFSPFHLMSDPKSNPLAWQDEEEASDAEGQQPQPQQTKRKDDDGSKFAKILVAVAAVVGTAFIMAGLSNRSRP